MQNVDVSLKKKLLIPTIHTKIIQFSARMVGHTVPANIRHSTVQDTSVLMYISLVVHALIRKGELVDRLSRVGVSITRMTVCFVCVPNQDKLSYGSSIRNRWFAPLRCVMTSSQLPRLIILTITLAQLLQRRLPWHRDLTLSTPCLRRSRSAAAWCLLKVLHAKRQWASCQVNIPVYFHDITELSMRHPDIVS